MSKLKKLARSYGRGGGEFDTGTKAVKAIKKGLRRRQAMLAQACWGAEQPCSQVFFNGQIWKVIETGVRYYILRPARRTDPPIAVKKSECFPVATEEIDGKKLMVSDDGRELHWAKSVAVNEAKGFVSSIAKIEYPFRFILTGERITVQRCQRAEELPESGSL
jgi:phage terminase large subunit-like protein